MATTEAESTAVEAMTGMFDGPDGPGDEEEAEEVDGAEAALVSMASGDNSSSIVRASPPRSAPAAAPPLPSPCGPRARPFLLGWPPPLLRKGWVVFAAWPYLPIPDRVPCLPCALLLARVYVCTRARPHVR